jgi:hypothetical protein
MCDDNDGIFDDLEDIVDLAKLVVFKHEVNDKQAEITTPSSASTSPINWPMARKVRRDLYHAKLQRRNTASPLRTNFTIRNRKLTIHQHAYLNTRIKQQKKNHVI